MDIQKDLNQARGGLGGSEDPPLISKSSQIS